MSLIGKPTRTYTIEPLESPVPTSRPADPAAPVSPPSQPLVRETVGKPSK